MPLPGGDQIWGSLVRPTTPARKLKEASGNKPHATLACPLGTRSKNALQGFSQGLCEPSLSPQRTGQPSVGC